MQLDLDLYEKVALNIVHNRAAVLNYNANFDAEKAETDKLSRCNLSGAIRQRFRQQAENSPQSPPSLLCAKPCTYPQKTKGVHGLGEPVKTKGVPNIPENSTVNRHVR